MAKRSVAYLQQGKVDVVRFLDNILSIIYSHFCLAVTVQPVGGSSNMLKPILRSKLLVFVGDELKAIVEKAANWDTMASKVGFGDDHSGRLGVGELVQFVEII